MNKLTPRQNELISGALCSIASSLAQEKNAPEVLTTLRCALVAELEAVTAETNPGSSPQGEMTDSTNSRSSCAFLPTGQSASPSDSSPAPSQESSHASA